MKRERYRSGEKALTTQQVDKFLSNITDVVDEALFKTALSTGIRREDVVRIKQVDVNVKEYSITFYESKKKRIKTVFVNQDTMNSIVKCMRVFPGTFVFPGRSDHKKRGGGHLSGRQAYNRLQTILKRTGLDGKPFHALRATCIKLCQSRGWSPEQTAEHVGDRISTIQEHYLTPSIEEMKQAALEKGVLG